MNSAIFLFYYCLKYWLHIPLEKLNKFRNIKYYISISPCSLHLLCFFPLYNISTQPTIPFLLCYIQSWKWAGLKGLEHLMQEYKRLDYDITRDIFHTYQNKKTNPSQNLQLKTNKEIGIRRYQGTIIIEPRIFFFPNCSFLVTFSKSSTCMIAALWHLCTLEKGHWWKSLNIVSSKIMWFSYLVKDVAERSFSSLYPFLNHFLWFKNYK